MQAPSLSRRILAVKSSPTVALNAKVKSLQKAGTKVLNFGVGEPDYDTPAPIVEAAVSALHKGRTRYSSAGGSPELRAAISTKLQRDNGLDIAPDNIVVGMGAKEVLFHCFLATLNEGDEVLIPSPYWVSYPDQIIAAGGKPVFVPPGPDFATEPVSLADLERLATPRTVAIILNSPNNPAGYMYSPDFAAKLAKFLLQKPWWVISDEIYEYLAFDHAHTSMLTLEPKLKERFLLVNGLSKSHAMTGWRVGYVAGPPQVMKLVRDLQSHSSTCLSPFVEDAACVALTQGRSIVEKQIEIMRKRRDLAVRCLDAIKKAHKAPLLDYVVPQGAFYVFIDVRPTLARGGRAVDTFAFAEQLLLTKHLAMVPGDPFGAPGYLRMSYATDDASIEEGIKRLGEALAEYP